ncbi:Anthranilate synthase component 1 [Gossypium arboreum]|uniref:Anthranilate synthase component 1 n=1 Tax=Gossypium arboreum TaxID=29729 RepID=A0A0B0PJ66_GOSAR|nr:Anthranilate synthase component 1 [Gossypium arboreum]
MLRSPQKCPFPNWTKLRLSRDKPVCDYLSPWLRLLNRHGRVIYLCKSCFDLTNLTRLCSQFPCGEL